MSEPIILSTIQEMQNFRRGLADSAVGFVPTMGALHFGHQTLIEKSVLENQTTIVSLFVNPTQFNDKSDFEKYPKTWEQDLKLIQKAGGQAVFSPDFADIYPDHYKFKVCETEFSKNLCGLGRPGHFDGVLTIVNKLFNIIRPTKAYFGEKDFQQLSLVEKMVQAFFMDLQIIRCPTVRENSGLAMSSRNARLSEIGKKNAAQIYESLNRFKSTEEIKIHLSKKGFEIDYVEDIDGRRFAAVFLEGVRLIDNIEIGKFL
jgi:pantoate--beta-alanine ligase